MLIVNRIILVPKKLGMKKVLAELIRSKRAGKGLKQEDIADRLGISIGTYSNIERGKTDITVSRLYEIADILDVSIYDFLPPNMISSANIQEPTNPKLNIALDTSFKDEIRKLIQEEMAKQPVVYPSLSAKNKRR